MPTKRTFDLIVITTLLVHAAWAIPKSWAARVNADNRQNGISNNFAGAIRLMG